VFLSRMSHELRTPLNAVLGFAQLMLRDADAPLATRQRERGERIVDAAQHLLALIEDVLDLSAIESGALNLVSEPVALAPLFTEAVDWLTPEAARAGIALRVGPVDAAVRADARRVRQVLSNLLSNALKYNDRGGWVELTQIHEPTRAGLRVRVAAQAPSAAAATVVPAPAFDLLCIEDNPVNLMLVEQLVALRPGIRLHTAKDGRSGVERAIATRPRAVLLDLQLPDIDGAEVLRRLRAEPTLAGTRVIALSANALPDDIERARRAGFDDYWTKPIHVDRFLRPWTSSRAESRALPGAVRQPRPCFVAGQLRRLGRVASLWASRPVRSLQ
jgi:CheY-like chemotaxis protein